MSVVEGLPFSEEKKAYIVDVLDPVLEEMVSEVLTILPADPLLYMIKWLRKRSGRPPNQRQSLMERNQALKNEVNACTSFMHDAATTIQRKAGDPHDEDEEEEEDDDCDEIPESYMKPESQMKTGRASVSAEAYGQWNVKKAFTPPVFPKTDVQRDRLQKTLQKSFLFSSLEQKDVNTVLDAMKECKFEAGLRVINEGDTGDFLFVVEEGILECKKLIDGSEKVVKTCQTGDVFGELALLYNCPRAASCDVKDSASICWQLDRETFNHIVKEAATKRRSKYDEFLKTVSLLSSLDQYERSQIADGLKPEIYKKGDVIVKQDEPGNMFYIIEEGNLYASKTFPGEGARRVMDYKPGDYFGELALLKNQPRAASVIVESAEAKVLALSRNSFTKMLGPLQDILGKKAEQKYR
eukprot:gnl/TRDRNA2_/TRDRNA2_168865_c1_seq1.p1 gnl/TRDRNA2_/TRDRNA2_168865_c1~~gnl/TRDRNA2_/TRDRNA2_168865_c1_seq1.p1  ORF type:complete len:410 (+),score=126.02 gnl/TRDRNA2_/TRDRNA2_168865_c1_seq1:88-1317(+)